MKNLAFLCCVFKKVQFLIKNNCTYVHTFNCNKPFGFLQHLKKKMDKDNFAIVCAGISLDAILREAKVPPSHSIEHARRTLFHAEQAIKANNAAASPLHLTRDEEMAIMLAALLHDADDTKYFSKNLNYENARLILRIAYPEVEDLTIQMISYVSASKNQSKIPLEAKEKPWLLWPRYCDRLEAIGWIGVTRTWDYTLETSRPLYTAGTSRAITEEELFKIATKERYSKYTGNSTSMIDHIYDKLLHISPFTSSNVYLDTVSKQRNGPLIELCLTFGRAGKLDNSFLDRARQLVKEEAVLSALP